MSDKQNPYYYKEVEASFDRIKAVCSTMLPLAEAFSIPEADVIKKMATFQVFMWSKHPSVLNLNLSEDELTDNQKEEIALSNKVEFDATIAGLNELCDLLDATLRNSEIIKSAIKNIVNIISDSVESNLIYDYNGELKGDYEATPLILTAEELYWALNLLGQEKTRLALSEQAPHVFDSLYNAYQKGKESFTYAFSNLTSAPMKGLRALLMSSINDTNSFMHFIEAQLMNDKRLLATLADEILGSGESGFSKILNYLLFGESVSDLNFTEIQTSYENEVGKALTTAENIKGLSRFENRNIQKIKDSLTNEMPSIPSDQVEEFDISSKLLNVITTLMDKWLILKIHEKADENTQISPIDELKREKSKKSSVSFERLPVPTRFTENKIGSQYYEGILRQLYSLYGYNFINMSEDEFVYFFEGTNKKPLSYKPPYYWGSDAPSMKALLRILYSSSTGETNSSRSFGRLILMPRDSNMEEPYHNWRGKHNLGVGRLTALEKSLQDIVRNVTGKELAPIDLNRKYDYGIEDGHKAIKNSKKKKDKNDEETES